MTEDFNKWWNSDGLVEDNPYERDTPAFWAWEGWQAAYERTICANCAKEIHNCARCGEVNPAEIHTCTPQDTVLLSYWQEEARRYAENAEYWRSKAQPETDIVQDAVVYGTGITKDGKRIDPASIYKEREWQGLTDEEIKEILDCGRPNLVNIKKAEQKLKEKNI